jgi:biotin synthase
MGLIEKASLRLPGKICTHLIAGLGETKKQITALLERLYAKGVTVGLFAFTPVKGTMLENKDPPDIKYYRSLQAAHYRIKNKTDKTGPSAYETSGCEGCNRPFYNERPGGIMYNYPRPLTQEEYNEIAA